MYLHIVELNKKKSQTKLIHNNLSLQKGIFLLFFQLNHESNGQNHYTKSGVGGGEFSGNGKVLLILKRKKLKQKIKQDP